MLAVGLAGGLGAYMHRKRDGRNAAVSRVATTVLVLAGAAALTGCVVVPTAPSVMALPGTAKSFDQFLQDDQLCRDFASARNNNVDVNQAATRSALRTAAVGTALGAVAGAAFAGGTGAAIGAGAGLLAGSASGNVNASTSMVLTQSLYDQSYIQCMYAAGNRVPIRGDFTSVQQGIRYDPPPPPSPNWKPPAGSDR